MPGTEITWYQAQTAREGLGVAVLLLSAVWPLFTYWGQKADGAVLPQPFIRRNGFTMTYQVPPTAVCLRMLYALCVLAPADWYYEDGRGPSWAIARMWFWYNSPPTSPPPGDDDDDDDAAEADADDDAADADDDDDDADDDDDDDDDTGRWSQGGGDAPLRESLCRRPRPPLPPPPRHPVCRRREQTSLHPTRL
eukprot:361643-Rhodomonas_salina.2